MVRNNNRTGDTARRLTTLTLVTVKYGSTNLFDFFKTCEGLWLSKKFKDYILSGASKKQVSAGETIIGSARLSQVANDVDISNELPAGYIFTDVDIFLVCLATFIEGQWGGKSGALFNDGFTNIFYVRIDSEVFAVIVSWVVEDQEWLCDAERLNDFRWLAGYRAFSATIA